MKWWWAWTVLFLGLLIVVVWQTWPEQSAHLVMCDVGQGDGIIVTQGFSQLVVDVGYPGAGILPCLSREMPFWDKQIEVIVITHTDKDHAGSLDDLLSRYVVEKIVTTEQAKVKIQEIVGDRAKVESTWAGQQWKWGIVTGQVIWPRYGDTESNDNRGSLIVRLKLDSQTSVWLAADSDEVVETELVSKGLIIPSTILKVAHHGSASATSEPFLEILRPSQAWISVGKQNRYGHPSNDVLSRLTSMETIVRRTDESGTIHY